jgi:thiol-disulfide isomerase/thioredoxin
MSDSIDDSLYDADVVEYIQTTLKDNKIVLFSKTTCPPCKKLKEILNEKEIKFAEIIYDKDRNFKFNNYFLSILKFYYFILLSKWS